MRDKAEEFSKEGLAYIEQGEYDNAIVSLSKAVEINPGFFEAWFRLGVAYRHKQDYENALICNLKAWEVNPDSSYIDADIFDCYNKLVVLNSKNYHVWWKIAEYFSIKGVYEEALECYDRAIDIIRLSNSSINPSELFIKKGNIFYEIGELESAVNSYDRALEIDSTDKIARNNKMKVLSEISKKKRCPECGAPLKLKIGQLHGEQQYVIVDIEDLKFLIKKVKDVGDPEFSYEYGKIKKIEENYKKIYLNEEY